MSTISLTGYTPSSTRLTGPRKWAARVIWLALALPVFAMQLLGARPYFEALQTVCNETVAPCTTDQPTAESAASLAEDGVSLTGYAIAIWLSTMLSLLVWEGVGVLVFVLRSDDWMAMLVSLFLIVFGSATFASGPLDYMAVSYAQLEPLILALRVFGELLITAFFLMFPNGRIVPRWLWWLLIVRPLFAALDYVPGLSIPEPVYYATFLVPIALLLWAQVYRYRRVATPYEKRQTRWVLFGVVVGVGFFLLIVLTAALTGLWAEDISRNGIYSALLGQLLMSAIPLSIGIAMLRSRLWDIDVVIRKTTAYAMLTALLLLVYFGSVIILQRLLSPVTGESTVAVVLSTLLIAALFLPLRRRVQDTIDKRFFRRKYNAEQILEQFAATVRDETDLDALTAELVRVIQETMQPASVSVWLAAPGDKAQTDLTVIEE